jgi:hypothetical protein
MLDSYGLDRDDFLETFKDLQFISSGDPALIDRYESLDSKVKSSLTRLYNSSTHLSQALVDEQQIGKKRRINSSANEDDLEDGYLGTTEDLEATRVDEGSSDEDDEAAIQELLKKTKSKTSKASTSTAKGKATVSSSVSTSAKKAKK